MNKINSGKFTPRKLIFDKPFGTIVSIVKGIQEILESSGVELGQFEFNGKTVIVNKYTRLEDCNIVIDKIRECSEQQVISIAR